MPGPLSWTSKRTDRSCRRAHEQDLAARPRVADRVADEVGEDEPDPLGVGQGATGLGQGLAADAAARGWRPALAPASTACRTSSLDLERRHGELQLALVQARRRRARR